MILSFGAMFAVLALVCWGISDFAIQRTVRTLGSIPALFFIAVVGSIALFPFAQPHFSVMFGDSAILKLLLLAFTAMLVEALVAFAAFKKGKLSVVEPVLSFELVFTVLIGVLILGEHMSRMQVILSGIIFIGVELTTLRRVSVRWWEFWKHKNMLEQGVVLAILAAVFLAFTNIFTGLASQSVNPIAVIWFIHTAIAVVTFTWFCVRRELKNVLTTGVHAWKLVLTQSIFDNAAWVAYGLAVTYLPIAIATSITESYVALAATLGIVLNKERLQKRQYVGMIVTLCAAIVLAAVSSSGT